MKVLSGLENLDETIGFLELLKEKNIRHDSPLWVAADELYYNYLRIERDRGNQTGIAAERYAQLFSSEKVRPIVVGREDFKGEYGLTGTRRSRFVR